MIYDTALDFVIYIYDNPSYYIGYYLNAITGNLGMLGSVSSDKIIRQMLHILIKKLIYHLENKSLN